MSATVTTPAAISLTSNQITMLEAHAVSQYQDEWCPVGIAVWTWDVVGGLSNKSAGGSVAKAVEAGLIDAFVESDPEENTIVMKLLGWVSLLAEYGVPFTGIEETDGRAFLDAFHARQNVTTEPFVETATETPVVVEKTKAVKVVATPAASTGIKTCPKCGVSGGHEELFGFRNTKHVRKDGEVVITPRVQSYCRPCRSSKAAK